MLCPDDVIPGTTLIRRLALLSLSVATVLTPCIAFAGETVVEAEAETRWLLTQEGQGMQVFTGEVSGSPFMAVRVVTRISAPVENIVDVLGDGSDCAEWRGMCESSEVLEVVSENERLVHMVLDLPWPISDRDAVVRSVTDINIAARTATIDITPAPEALPEQKHIRATTNAQFFLKVIDDKEVELTYTVHADLGGDLSPGIINPRLTESTVEDVERLVALAEG